MTPQLRKHRAVLESKANELSHTLRQRDRIAIESSAEEIELTVLAGQRELAVRALDRNAQVLREVRAALERLDSGEFGVCERCEDEIAAKRLDAIPWARYCVRCQEAHDREKASEAESFRFAA